MSSSESGQSGDESGEENVYAVERLLDYMPVLEKNVPDSEQLEEYDPSTGDTVWVVKYLVKWKGYDRPEDNTWEPKVSFGEWTYDDNIKQIEKADPTKKKHKYVLREVEELNDKLRDNHTISRLRLTSKGKDKPKPKPTSIPPSSSKKRSTNNSGTHLFDPDDMINAGNAPRATSKLRITPPPVRVKPPRQPQSDESNSPQQRGNSMSPVLAPARRDTRSPAPSRNHGSLRKGTSQRPTSSDSEDDHSVATQLGRPQPSQSTKKTRPIIHHESSSDDEGQVHIRKPASTKASTSSSKDPAQQSARPIVKTKSAPIASSGGEDEAARPVVVQTIPQQHKTTDQSAKQAVNIVHQPALKPPSVPLRPISVAVAQRPSQPTPQPTPLPPPPPPSSSTKRVTAEASGVYDADDALPTAKKRRVVLEPFTESDDDQPLAYLRRPSSPAHDDYGGEPLRAATPPLPASPLVGQSSLLDSRSSTITPVAIEKELEPKFISLSDEKLRIEFRQTELSRKLMSKTGASFPEQIKAYWRIGGRDNFEENEANFELAMRNKVIYIAVSSTNDGIKSGVPGAATRAREVRADVLALQLLLDTCPGVKVVEEPHSSVEVVFVHARDREEVGKLGGRLDSIEPLRTRASHCFLFGEASVPLASDDPRRSGVITHVKKKWFRNLWTQTGVVTATPAALLEHPDQARKIVELCKALTCHRSSRDGRHDISAVLPASYFVQGGPFEVKLLAGEDDKPRVRAVSTVHFAAREGSLSLFGPFPTPSGVGHRPGTAFPLPQDVVKYDQRKWNELAQWLPKSLRVTDLPGLLRDVALYKAQNCQVRRWIVIASATEVAGHNAAAAPGVEVITFGKAQNVARRLV